MTSLNDRWRPLYVNLGIPCGCADRFCIGAAALTWGGRTGVPDYALGDADFISSAPNRFDSYVFPSDWTMGPKARQSPHIETWVAQARNISKMSASVYGSEHSNGRMLAVEELRALRVREPLKYTLAPIRDDWGELNHLRIQALKESTDILRMHANVDRPTYGRLSAIGMAIDPTTGAEIFTLPDTFNVRGANGYFQTEVVRKMDDAKELSDWHHYHNTSTRPATSRASAVNDVAGLPGPPLTAVERRLAGTTAPTDKSGEKL